MSTNLSRATDALFPADNSVTTGNVKFFTNGRVPAEALAEQLNRADAQVREGIAKPSTEFDGDLPTKSLA